MNIQDLTSVSADDLVAVKVPSREEIQRLQNELMAGPQQDRRLS